MLNRSIHHTRHGVVAQRRHESIDVGRLAIRHCLATIQQRYVDNLVGEDHLLRLLLLLY